MERANLGFARFFWGVFGWARRDFCGDISKFRNTSVRPENAGLNFRALAHGNLLTYEDDCLHSLKAMLLEARRKKERRKERKGCRVKARRYICRSGDSSCRGIRG
jgi:hypothetical protein